MNDIYQWFLTWGMAIFDGGIATAGFVWRALEFQLGAFARIHSAIAVPLFAHMDQQLISLSVHLHLLGFLR
jgi:hypothetical protein